MQKKPTKPTLICVSSDETTVTFFYNGIEQAEIQADQEGQYYFYYGNNKTSYLPKEFQPLLLTY